MEKTTPPNHPTPTEKNRLAISELTTSQDFSGSLANKAEGENSSIGKTSVADVRDWQAGDVYIGRARPTWLLPASLKGIFPDGIKQSIWRNTPLPDNATPEQRAESIAAYKARLLKRQDLIDRLPELKGRRLVCWCKRTNDACHGDVLAELADDPSSLLVNVLADASMKEKKEWEASLEREHLAAVKAGEVAAVKPEFAPAARWRFSRFASVLDKAPDETKLAEIMHTIRTSAPLAKLVAKARAKHLAKQAAESQGKEVEKEWVVAKGKRVQVCAYTLAKKDLPAVAFGGVFKGGHAAKQLTEYSGLVVIDLDHLTADQLADVRSKLMNDKRLVALFVSPGGAGLKCLFWTSRPAADHQLVWSDIVAELRQTTGVLADESGKDVCRLCFLSHDPDAVYWPDAAEWLVLGRTGALPSSDPATGVLALSDKPQVAEKVNAVQTKSTKPAPKLTKDEVRSMLAVITIKQHDRPTWLSVAHSVGNTLTESEAVQVLDEWSDLLNTEARRYADEQGGYTRQLAGRDNTCTAATLIHHAKENGWRPPIPAVEVFYDYQRKVFCAKNSDGNWLREGADNLSRWMVAKRIAKDREQASLVCGQAMDTRSVDWSAPLAGYPEGYRTMGDARLLITRGPKLITACAGEWPTIKSLLLGLFAGDAAAEQFNSFVLWIKHRVQMLENVSHRAGHILCLVGPAKCGKSLLQRLITEMLGGRVASPVAYFFSDEKSSGFNSELFKAEHLQIEDEGASIDPKSRARVGDHWKRVAVNQDHKCHAKNQEALTLRPLWSCSVSLNDEGERLLVIPPLTSDLVDKVMILKCASPTDPFPTATDAAKAEYWRRLVSELPAFLAYCQTKEVVVKDTETRDERDERSRMGFVAYRSPEIMAETEGHAPERQLLELIDLVCFGGTAPAKVVLSLVEWEILLTTDTRYGKKAVKLLDWSGALMTYFKRLKGERDPRVKHIRDRTARTWEVTREVEDDQ